MPTIDEIIEQAAALPASATASPTSETVTQHNLKDLLAVRKELAANQAFEDCPAGALPGIQSFQVTSPGAGGY